MTQKGNRQPLAGLHTGPPRDKPAVDEKVSAASEFPGVQIFRFCGAESWI